MVSWQTCQCSWSGYSVRSHLADTASLLAQHRDAFAFEQ